MPSSYTLGISCFYHDSAVTLLKDSEIIYAAQEERFTRIKHDSSFPTNAIRDCLEFSKLNLNNINQIIFYDNPKKKFKRILSSFCHDFPKNFSNFVLATDIWLNKKLFMTSLIKKELKNSFNFNVNSPIYYCDHHTSHASSAFYPSPFKESVILTIDGVGEWSTTSVAIGKENEIKIMKEIKFPHSIGLLYSAFTFYLGFKVNSGEYKVMGLAPYGNPKYYNKILDNLIDLKDDGSFKLNFKYFDYISGSEMINSAFEKLFSHKKRKAEENLEDFHLDIAASIQKVLETIILKITNNLYNEYKIENLCLAGGVALNCVANSKILEQGLFKNIWVQPAAGDAGGSLGCALFHVHQKKGLQRKSVINKKDNLKGSYLGNNFSNTEIEKALNENQIVFNYYENKDEILDKTVEFLINQKAIGWFQGRMEFGPRALGNRSIIADPRSEFMQEKLNLKIKFRESFRPFAPSILEEKCKEWFNFETESPYMLFVADVNDKVKLSLNSQKTSGIFGKLKQKRSLIPAVTHVDYSARLQTISKESNLLFYNLLSKFNERTNCPILINTSFNIRGEPIVCTPNNAIQCFMGTNLDCLIIENFIIEKKYQNKNINKNFRKKFKLD